MNRLLVSAFSIFLLAGLPAHAAPPDDHHGDHDGGEGGRHKPPAQAPGGAPHQPQAQPQHQYQPQRQYQPQHQPQSQQQPQRQYQPQPQQQPQQRPHAAPPRPGAQPPHSDQRNQWQGDHRPDRHTEPYRGPQNYRTGQRPKDIDRHRPRQFDARDYHHNYQAQQRFRWHRYQPPRGWYERRWYYGDRLPALFWGRNYWIEDFWMFGLVIPPYGYEWVRYGDDALLVNVYTGEILQVVYGLFY